MSYVALADSKDRERWLAVRAMHVTASDVASVLGHGRQSRNVLLAEKRGERKPDADIGGLAMVQAGRFLEEGALRWFEHDQLFTSFEPNTKLLGRSSGELIAATPDAIADGVPVEAKNVSFESWHNWTTHATSTKGWAKQLPLPVPVEVVTRFAPFNPKVAVADQGTVRGEWRAACAEARRRLYALGPPVAPLKYYTQLAVQMWVMDASHGWITVVIGGTNRIDLRYERDYNYETYWRGQANEFLEEWKNT